MCKHTAKSHITQLWKGASVAIAATASSGASFYIDENAQIDLFLARHEFPWKWHLWALLLLVPIQHVFCAEGWAQLLEGSRVGRGSAGTEKARLKATKLVLVAREGRRGKQETNKCALIWVKSSVLLAYIALGE